MLVAKRVVRQHDPGESPGLQAGQTSHCKQAKSLKKAHLRGREPHPSALRHPLPNFSTKYLFTK